MNAFEHLTRQVMRDQPGYIENRVSKEEYKKFCHEYLFENLKEVSFGLAFNKKFGIVDYVLSILRNESSAKDHIHSMGYVDE